MCGDLADVFGSSVLGGVLSGVQHVFFLFGSSCGSVHHVVHPNSDSLPSGELTFCHGKSPFLMGKSTISMAIFNSFL